MTTSACISVSPEDPEVHCNRPGEGRKLNHAQHSGYSWTLGRYVNWPNTDYEPLPETVKRDQQTANRSKLKEIGQRIRHGRPN